MSDSRPLSLPWESCGAEDNEDQAGPWEASAQTVSRMALRYAWAPCLPSTTRPSDSVHVASPGAGESQISENQDVSVEKTTAGMKGIYIFREHSAEVGGQLCTLNPAGLPAGGSI